MLLFLTTVKVSRIRECVCELHQFVLEDNDDMTARLYTYVHTIIFITPDKQAWPESTTDTSFLLEKKHSLS